MNTHERTVRREKAGIVNVTINGMQVTGPAAAIPTFDTLLAPCLSDQNHPRLWISFC